MRRFALTLAFSLLTFAAQAQTCDSLPETLDNPDLGQVQRLFLNGQFKQLYDLQSAAGITGTLAEVVQVLEGYAPKGFSNCNVLKVHEVPGSYNYVVNMFYDFDARGKVSRQIFAYFAMVRLPNDTWSLIGLGFNSDWDEGKLYLSR